MFAGNKHTKCIFCSLHINFSSHPLFSPPLALWSNLSTPSFILSLLLGPPSSLSLYSRGTALTFYSLPLTTWPNHLNFFLSFTFSIGTFPTPSLVIPSAILSLCLLTPTLHLKDLISHACVFHCITPCHCPRF